MQRTEMKKKTNKRLLIIVLIFLAIVFALVTFGVSKAAYNKRVSEEKLTTLDFYSMQKISSENASAVMDALKSGSREDLESLMPGAKGIDGLMAFADWSKAEFKDAVSLGAGSLSEAPDGNGVMDISEKFIVDVGETKYVLFIETLTSRWGRSNDGVSAVGATTYEWFDAVDYDWLGEAGKKSVLAGELFRKKGDK